MSFNSSEVFVRGHAFNTVEGNQVNISAQVANFNSQREIERTEYDEFEEVKRGNVITLTRLHTEELSEREKQKDGKWVKTMRSGQRTVCAVEVHQRKYTAAIYEGKDAEMFWKRDFETYSTGLGKPEIWQLYGLNRSKIPFLIFHGELVPLAHVYKDSFWGSLVVSCLWGQLDCIPNAMWLNTQGNLCKGLLGPVPDTPETSVVPSIIVPSSAQFLQDDISFQYFCQFSSPQFNRTILHHACLQLRSIVLYELFPKLADHHPPSDHTYSYSTKEYPYLKYLSLEEPDHLPLEFISGLRFDTIYSPSRGAVVSCPRDGYSLWETEIYDGDTRLPDGMEMGDGLIRFELDGSGDVNIHFYFQDNSYFKESWLAQSSRIIDAHNMSETEEEQCFMVDLSFLLCTPSPHSEHQKLTCSLTFENPQPIYLFIHPPPMSISEFISWSKGHPRTHFWSLDENGQSEMSVEECKQWGLPELVPPLRYTNVSLKSWQTTVYPALRQWQATHGFDPTTTDWAQSLGYGLADLEIISRENDKAHFEELHKNTPWEYLWKQQETKSSSWWPWSRKAAAGSGPVSVKTGDQLDSDWEVISIEDT